MTSPGSSLSILVFLEDTALCKDVTKQLEHSKIAQIDWASSWPNAVAKIRDSRYSAAILDCNDFSNLDNQILEICYLETNCVLLLIQTKNPSSENMIRVKTGKENYMIRRDDFPEFLPSLIQSTLNAKGKYYTLTKSQIQESKLKAILETGITVNHEINSPLFAIKASAQLLQQRFSSDDPKTSRHLDRIVESCERISSIISRFINIQNPSSCSYADGVSMLHFDTSSADSSVIDQYDTAEIADNIAMLGEINKVLSNSQDLSLLYENLARCASRLLGNCGGGIWTVLNIKTAEYLELNYWTASQVVKEDYRLEKIFLPISEFPTLEKMLVHGSPIVIESSDDARLSEREKTQMKSFGVQSTIITPITHQGKVVGAFSLGKMGSNISHKERAVCQLIGTQLGFAIHNGLQNEANRRRSQLFQNLIESQLILTKNRNQNEKLQAIIMLIADQSNAVNAVIRLLEEEQLKLGAYESRNNDFVPSESILANEGLMKRILETEGPVIIPNFDRNVQDTIFSDPKLKLSETRCYMGVRLQTAGKIIGTIIISSNDMSNFTDESIDLFLAQSKCISIAIENDRLYEKSQKHNQELLHQNERILLKNELVHSIIASSQIDEICNLVISKGPLIFSCLQGLILLGDRESHKFQHDSQDIPIELDDPVIQNVLDTGKSTIIQNLQSNESILNQADALYSMGFRSLLIVPILFGHKKLGILAFCSNEINGFQADQMSVAENLANLIAMAVQKESLLEEISLSRTEWKAVFEAITDPLWIQDTDCRIQYVNNAVLETFKKSPDTTIGSHCGRILRGMKKDCSVCALKRIIDQKRQIVEEIRGPQDTIYLMSAYPIIETSGRLNAIVVYLKDITMLKSAQKQLVHATKLAAIGELSAGIAHNFNNLLTGVRGGAELLLMQSSKENFSEKTTKRLNSIIERLNQGDLLIRRLTSFSKGASIYPTKILLMDVIQEAMAICETHQDGKGILLKRKIAEDLPWVFGVESYLQQVLVNLILNAFHASKMGDEIVIEASNPNDDNFVELKVIDQGCGISENDMDLIFKPFFSKRQFGKNIGTGLGLGVSRSMMNAIGGELTVQSKLGEGSVFTMRIPINDPRVSHTEYTLESSDQPTSMK